MLKVFETGDGRDVERGKFAVAVAVVSRHGDHRGVVGRELEFGQEGPPAAPCSGLGDAVAQPRVGRDASGDVADAGLFRGADELVEQDLDDGCLQRGAEVGLVALDELRVLGHGVAQRVEERGLETRERVVVTLHVGACEAEGLRVALLGQAVDHRSARVGESHHLGALVERFACGIVDRRADDAHLERRIDAHDLRVSAAHEQAQEREIRVGKRTVGQVDEVREDVPLQVVHLDHRDVARDGESLGEGDPHEQRSEQSGTARESDGVELVGRDACFAQRRVHHGDDVLLVRPRCQFGDDAAVLHVHGLRGDDVRQQHVAAQHRRRGVVARGFDAENCNIHPVFRVFNYFS